MDSFSDETCGTAEGASCNHDVCEESFVGVLKTICLFLESLNLRSSSVCLQDECIKLGYPEFSSTQARVLVLQPNCSQTRDSASNCNCSMSNDNTKVMNVFATNDKNNSPGMGCATAQALSLCSCNSCREYRDKRIQQMETEQTYIISRSNSGARHDKSDEAKVNSKPSSAKQNCLSKQLGETRRKSSLPKETDFEEKIAEHLTNPASKILSKDHLHQKQTSPTNQDLDYKHIKSDLVLSNDQTKLMILQALRWKLTHAENHSEMETNLTAFIRNDVLNLHSYQSSETAMTFLEHFYVAHNNLFQETISRLVNTFASTTLGRDYLSSDNSLLENLLVPILLGTHAKNIRLESRTRDYIIAIMQKLSLRRKLRKIMIASGLVEFLLHFLASNVNQLRAYCCEFSTALLMNLCLHNEAKAICSANVETTTAVLRKMLNFKHQCCLLYTNGILYSLLSEPAIRSQVKSSGLINDINRQYKIATGDMKKQIEIILQLCEQGNDHDFGAGHQDHAMSGDPEDECDILEPELDGDDPVQSTGDILEKYILDSTTSGVTSPRVSQLGKPTTPQSLKRSASHCTEFDSKTVLTTNKDSYEKIKFKIVPYGDETGDEDSTTESLSGVQLTNKSKKCQCERNVRDSAPTNKLDGSACQTVCCTSTTEIQKKAIPHSDERFVNDQVNQTSFLEASVKTVRSEYRATTPVSKSVKNDDRSLVAERHLVVASHEKCEDETNKSQRAPHEKSYPYNKAEHVFHNIFTNLRTMDRAQSDVPEPNKASKETKSTEFYRSAKRSTSLPRDIQLGSGYSLEQMSDDAKNWCENHRNPSEMLKACHIMCPMIAEQELDCRNDAGEFGAPKSKSKRRMVHSSKCIGKKSSNEEIYKGYGPSHPDPLDKVKVRCVPQSNVCVVEKGLCAPTRSKYSCDCFQSIQNYITSMDVAPKSTCSPCPLPCIWKYTCPKDDFSWFQLPTNRDIIYSSIFRSRPKLIRTP